VYFLSRVLGGLQAVLEAVTGDPFLSRVLGGLLGWQSAPSL